MTTMAVPPIRPGRVRVTPPVRGDEPSDRDYSDRRTVAANIAAAVARARTQVTSTVRRRSH